MTILVSVLSEAYQSRYSTMMHNGLFDKAIRSYQNKTHTNRQASHADTPTYDKSTMTVAERRQALDDTRVEMAAIPPKIIAQAKVFHAHLQYVLTHNTQEKPPPGLQRALDELMDEEAMNDELRKEVLQDGEARRTLFMMSFERTLKRMVENAERVSKLIEERDSLEDGLGFGLDRNGDDIDELDQADEEDDAFADSPQDMRHNDKGDEQNAADEKKTTGKGHWLKLRSGILSARALRPNANRAASSRAGGPYFHTSGSQSEPHLATTEEEEEDGKNDDNAVPRVQRKEKGKKSADSTLSSRKFRTRPVPQRQPSKLGAVRFADNPYGDHQDGSNEKNAGSKEGDTT